jgi:hypothetical protein
MIHGIQSAATYCNVSVSTLRKHIYQLKTLTPDQKIGKTLIFTQATLDQWQANRRPGGRPRKETTR